MKFDNSESNPMGNGGSPSLAVNCPPAQAWPLSQSDVEPEPLPAWKRLMDVGLIVLALPILLPLMIVIVATIKLVSKGPVLFRQERIGYKGRPFMCLKFRTMHTGNNVGTHKDHLAKLMTSNAPMTKMDAKGDPRIIRFGVCLRCSGLDELPQLINVLFGDMSLVGPRPCVRYEYEQYLPWQKARFEAVPGLTGWWQVNGKNRTSFERMIQLDIEYTRRKSALLDCWIIVKTLPALFIQMIDTRRERRALARASQKGAN
jgi:lipopolysaccharide/colanic/teichoic acid biosynthesis glycosyltransferase